MTAPAPARVFGYVAAEADVCVLLRRGPSDWVLMVRWDLANDQFEIGQWLKARVYERACDLSPDGELFALQALISKGPIDRRGQFSAVSRPPCFTALAYWSQSTISPSFGWACPKGKLFPRKAPHPQRGELPVGRNLYEEGREPFALGRGWECQRFGRSPTLVRDSAVGPLQWRLSWFHWPGLYFLGNQKVEAQWADVDHCGRLLLAREGRVYVRDADGERELIDLNPYEFRPLAAPDWAKQWP